MPTEGVLECHTDQELVSQEKMARVPTLEAPLLPPVYVSAGGPITKPY